MWLLLRLAMAAIVAVMRYSWRNRSLEAAGPWNGNMLYRRRSGRNEEALGFGFSFPLVFELVPETKTDRLLKQVRLLVEQQTGDVTFDRRVYIRCDHPGLGHILSHSQPARSACLEMFSGSVRRIVSDGSYLWAETRFGSVAPSETILALHALRENLLAVDSAQLTRYRDPFLWRATAVEALIWGIAAYAVAGLLVLPRFTEIPASVPRMLGLTFASTATIGTLLAATIYLILRGSSRIKAIAWEAVLVLGVSLPVASGALVLDVNRTLGHADSQQFSYRIAERHMMHYTAGFRRSRVTRVEFLVRVEPTQAGQPAIPRYLSIPRESYERPSDMLSIEIAYGYLGLPWINAIDAVRYPVSPVIKL